MLIYLFVSALFLFECLSAQVLPIGVVLNAFSLQQIPGIALLNFTVNELNAKNAFPIPIQLVFRDSLNSNRQAVMQTDSLVNQFGIVSLIGEYPSAITQTIASSMSQYNLTQCSASASYALSNKLEYPNYFRSIPSDLRSTRSFISLCLKMNWRRVALLVNNNAYGLGLATLFTNSAILSGIKVIENVFYSSGQTDFSNAFQKFKIVDTRIVFIFGYDTEIQYIMQAASNANMWGPNNVYVGSSATVFAFNSLYTPGIVVTASIVQQRALLDGFLINTPNEHVNDIEFQSLNARFYASTGMTPYVTNYFQNDCLLAMVAGFNLLLSQGVSMAQILSRSAPYNQTNFLNTTVSSVTGTLIFDSNGDRTGEFNFWSVTNGSTIATVYVNTQGNCSILNGGPVFALGSTSIPVDGVILSELTIDTNFAASIILMVLIAIGILASVIGAILIIVYKESDSVKAVSPTITVLVTFGLIVCLCSSFTYIGKTVTRGQCLSHLYTANLGITAVIVLITLKAYRIFKFADSRRYTHKNWHDCILIVKGLAPMAVMVVILSVGDFINTSLPVYVPLLTSPQYYYECRRTGLASRLLIVVYEFFLFIFANILAYKIRHAHSAFNESKFLRLSIQNMFVTNVISRFVQTVFDDEAFLVKFYIQEFILVYSSMFILVCLVVRPLLRAVTITVTAVEEAKQVQGGSISVNDSNMRNSALAAVSAAEGLSTKIVVYVRNESVLFSKWDTNIFCQDSEGITVTPLQRVNAADKTSEKIKRIGIFFCAGTYKTYLHSRMENTITLVCGQRNLSIQFDDKAEASIIMKGLASRASGRTTTTTRSKMSGENSRT